MEFNLKEYKQSVIRKGRELAAEDLWKELREGRRKRQDLNRQETEILAEFPEETFKNNKED